MPKLASLLPWIGKSMVRLGLRALTLGLPIDDFLIDLAEDAMGNWKKNTNEAERRVELEELASTSPEEMRGVVHSLVDDLLPEGDAAQREALAGYLMQVPAQVRQQLRRPADTRGHTVPAGFALRKGTDLVPLLPTRLPRFRVGQKPLANLDYELVELLGMGGFGEVWKAINPNQRSAAPVALKFCHNEAAATELRNAARVLDALQQQRPHPGIVRLLRTYLSADPPCLEYEYVEGGDLVALIQDWHRDGHGPDPLAAGKVMLRLAEIVAHAHQATPPVVHRDLKPANILVVETQGKRRFKITDFGIGGIVGRAPTGNSTALVSGSYSIQYASPQQRQGSPADPRDDVYALGVIWYQLMTGNLSSGAPGGVEWLRDLRSRGLNDRQVRLLASCLEDNPNKRPANAVELVRRLREVFPFDAAPSGEKVAVPQPEPTPTPTPPPVPVRKPRRRTSLAGVLLALLLLGGATVLAAYLFREWLPHSAQVQPVEPAQRPRLTNSVGMILVQLPAGTFRRGSPITEADRGEDEFEQEVTLTQPFWLGIHEVTQKQYEEVMGENPSFFTGRRGGGPDSPVENLPWSRAVEFCDRLSQRPEEQKAGRVYTLPTEAQWEYAARGFSARCQVFDRGDSLSSLLANIDGNRPYGVVPASMPASLGRPVAVGSYAANPWGLFDLHGNVWEWCQDWYAKDTYKIGSAIDPSGPPEGHERVVRGGSYSSAGRYCRAAARDSERPGTGRMDLGFRVACAGK
jgi:formylglycine-generating enzyme required for sulfatase activity